LKLFRTPLNTTYLNKFEGLRLNPKNQPKYKKS
jgi:hypothetical protein